MTSDCAVPVEPTLHPALANRFSPTEFDPRATMSDAEVDVLLEAARRAPSAGSSQPWSFIIGRRGDAIHDRIRTHLARSSSRWAAPASLLVVNLAQIGLAAEPEWAYSEFAHYDLGQAVAHMTIQGLAMGLASHQFRAFDRDGLTREFDVPAHWEVTTMTAFGLAVGPATEAPGSTRARASRAEITWPRG
ncbi:nitroreductase family protein [Enemella evansiae]|uniref:nitroreductase family protein n=1 Tax=Enemella evansiae TaxID=2016499 RepID=UPI001E311435|nr:nitroreductase family protein [Enemella evansiae]